MSNDALNTLVLTALLALASGYGYYVTQQQQPAELERLEMEEKALRLARAEVQTLLVEQAQSKKQADDALARWNARYKVLPEVLTSPAVVAYLNALSRVGFDQFDLTLGGVQRRPDHAVYTYQVQGRARMDALYAFVWQVENGRGLYRVRDLRLNGQVLVEDAGMPAVAADDAVPSPGRQVFRVDFAMTVDAYFGGAEGMSAPDSVVTVPDHVLPPRRPARDIFRPVVLEQLPPNTDGLVDVETDALVSLVGGAAVFRTPTGTRSLRAGDRVYLGKLTEVDPERARVVAQLDKGGLRERVQLDLNSGERFRQALGPVQLAPLDRPSVLLLDAPPAPGTPEARGLYQGTR